MDALIIGLLMLIGGALRFHRLDSGLWYDEINTLLESLRPPLLEVVTHFPSNNNHLFYSVLGNLSIKTFGEAAWSARLPAVLFGIAAIPMLYRLGRLVGSRLEAVLATAILTVSYHHVWFSQNARGYTALLFFVLLATTLLLLWLEERRRGALVGYAIVAALASYTHLTMVFVVASHALVCAWVYFGPGRRGPVDRTWWPTALGFVGAGLLTVLLYAPVLLDMHDFFSQPPTGKKVATPIWALWAGIKGLVVGFGAVGGLAAGGAIFGAGLIGYFQRNRLALLLFLLPGPVTVGLALAMGRPIFPRFVFFLMGFALLIAVRGAGVIGDFVAARAKDRPALAHLGPALAILVAMVAVGQSLRSLPYGYAYPKQDYLGAVAFVQADAAPDEFIATLGATGVIPFVDYLEQPWQRLGGVEDLEAIRGRGQDVVLVFTMVSYIRTGSPDLWRVIETQCRELRKFHGTVDGGDIYVVRCRADRAV